MAETYTLQNTTWNTTISLPDDGAVINEANREPSIKGIGDNTRYLYERVNPQHTSVGGHYAVGVTGVSGSTKLTVNCNSGEADNVSVFLISNPDSSYDAAITKRGEGQFVRLNIGDATNGVVAGSAKIQVQATTGDAATDLQLEVRGASAATVFSVDKAGTIVTAMPAVTWQVAPASFHAQIRAAGQTDTAAVYKVDEATYTGHMDVADNNSRYIVCQESRLQVGDTITSATLHVDRKAGGTGSATLELRYKTAHATISGGSYVITVAAGTNYQTGSLAGLPLVVTDDMALYWHVTMANLTASAANEIGFKLVTFTFTRTRVR